MDNLVNIAIIGTGQAATTQFTTDLPTDALLEPSTTENVEHLLLLAAGSASIYRRAGYVPALFPEPIAATEPEEQAYCSPTIEQYLENLLRETTGEVLLETLQLMGQAHLLLPARLLPWALHIKKSHAKHRAHIYPLLGKRGLWLSQFQAEWAWVHQQNDQEIPLPPLPQKTHLQEDEKLVAYNIEHEEKEWQNILGNLPKPWSLAFSSFFLQKLSEHSQTVKDASYYQSPWYSTIREAATAIPPGCFNIALETCEQLPKKDLTSHIQRTWNNQIKQFCDIIKMRQQIREELKG
jgi:Family of unknown function (DUF5691)